MTGRKKVMRKQEGKEKKSLSPLEKVNQEIKRAQSLRKQGLIKEALKGKKLR